MAASRPKIIGYIPVLVLPNGSRVNALLRVSLQEARQLAMQITKRNEARKTGLFAYYRPVYAGSETARNTFKSTRKEYSNER